MVRAGDGCPPMYTGSVRWGALVLILALALLQTACDPGIEMKFVNKTGTAFCWYEQENDVGDPKLCTHINPNETHEYGTICQSDWDKLVVLTAGVRGREIYRNTATCGQWGKSGATVTIEERDGEFVVTDSLMQP